MDKIIFEGVLNFEMEDSGRALISEIDGTDNNMFVRVQSWDTKKTHPTARSYEGKRVRIIIESME